MARSLTLVAVWWTCTCTRLQPCACVCVWLCVNTCVCVAGIAESEMIGWWSELEEGSDSLPVRSSAHAVKVTTYLRKGHSALIVLANFGAAPVSVTLSFQWSLLGMTSAGATLRAPSLKVPPQQSQHWGVRPDGAKMLVPAATKGDPASLDGMILLLEAAKPHL
eukprot:COSAG06_NODE_442_length_15715_cov_16.651639_10_plen_164_part_00